MNEQAFDKKLNEYTVMTEAALAQYTSDESEVEKAMAYSLLSGGKRIRPVLTLAVCEMLGGSCVDALPYACALELIHTYSLIHDDLPCMDDDDTRRGKPSCHIAFGEATALLAGDGLLTRAFAAAASGKYPQAVTVVADCAYEMVIGQSEELVNAAADTSVGSILNIYEQKTCALIVAACVCGAIAAKADKDTAQRLAEYARLLGLAFQINDDLLDVDSKESALLAGMGAVHVAEYAAGLSEKAVDTIALLDGDGFLTELTRRLSKRDR